jgi:hypothetical protein
MTHPHIVIAAGGRQSSLAVRFEVGRVDGGILVVPGHQERSSLHRGGAAACQPVGRGVENAVRSELAGAGTACKLSSRERCFLRAEEEEEELPCSSSSGERAGGGLQLHWRAKVSTWPPAGCSLLMTVKRQCAG